MQNEALERFLRYVKINTQSNEDSETQPSTKCQLELGKLLKEELLALGLEDVELDEHGYVYATIWASEGYENVQPIGLIAHMDTSPAAPGEDVKKLKIIGNFFGLAPVQLIGQWNAEQSLTVAE